MPNENGELGRQIDLVVLLLFLALGIPPMVVGHLLLVGSARANYRNAISSHFSRSADHTQMQLVDYLERVSNQAANLGRVPEILDVVRSANQQQIDPEEFDQTMGEIDGEWAATDPIYSKFQRQLLENSASQFLREFNNVVTAFREIMVTDQSGRLVAASNKSSDYFQADEAWWRRAYLEGQGNRFVSGMQFDESANVYGMEIAQPLRESVGGEVIGIVKVIVDRHEIASLVDSTQLGGNIRALLISGDGTEILGPLRVVGYRFPEGFQISALGRLSVEATQELALPQEEREVFLGLPQFRIKDLIPDLDWYVVTNGPYDEVFAPFQNLEARFIYIVVGSLVVVVVLAIVFSRMLSKPVIASDPHLERL